MPVSGDPGVLNDLLLDGQEFRYLLNRAVQEGVWGATDHQVSAGGPTRSVDVAPGLAYVEGDTLAYFQGLYGCANQSSANSNSFVGGGISANGSANPRIDQIVLRVYDHAHDGSGLKTWRYEVIGGTATSGATLDNRSGAGSLPGSALRLADVRVGPSATSISAGDIRDRRPIRPSPIQPVGTILATGGGTADVGFLLCQGQNVNRTQYEALFTKLGTGFGVGDGSTTFTLPNLQDRVPVGKGSYAGTDALGEVGGNQRHLLVVGEMPNHAHGGAVVAVGDHSHSTSGTPYGGLWWDPGAGFGTQIASTGSGNRFSNGGGIAAGGGHGHGINAEGGGADHNNLQPYQVVNYQIKAF